MKLSKRTDYALRALVFVALNDRHGYVQAKDIARAEHLPAKFLEAVLLALRNAHLLKSKVGAGGGYRLAGPTQAVRVADIINALDRADTAKADPDRAPGPPTIATAAHTLVMEKLTDALEGSVGRMTLRQLLDEATARAHADHAHIAPADATRA